MKLLTADQVRELAPFERFFAQATTAAWCSYPGQAGINKMQDIWTSMTGRPYPYQPGCANCLLNLVRDMGTVYFAQKDAALAAEKAAGEETEHVEETAEKAAGIPAEETNAPEPGNQPGQKKNARKGKKEGKA